MKIAYIIRTFNEERYLPELLQAINRQKGDFDYEVIVIDSGSTDSTIEIAKKYRVTLTSIEKKDFSFGRSLNMAISISDASFCIIISAHCVPVDERWAEQLVVPLSKNPRVAVSYGRQIGGPTTKVSERQIFKKWFPDTSRKKSLNATGFCNNANAAIRRSLWAEKKYDEDLTGLEDLHWAEAMIQAGYEIVYEPDAVVVHHHDEAWAQVENRYFREAIALKKIRPDMRVSALEATLLFLKHIYLDIASSKEIGNLLPKLKEVSMFRYFQFKGTYKGLNKRDKVSDDLKKQFYY